MRQAILTTILAGGLVFGAGAARAETAVFAGGCFWSMQHAFEGIKGVADVKAGYAGGTVANPSYEEVSTGKTGHRESVQVTYDPSKISYARLLDIYWRNTDPMDGEGQFCDKGDEYRPAIFPATEAEKQTAEKVKESLSKRFHKQIATEILPAGSFYPAEDYHQFYADNHPVAYGAYREGCGRVRDMQTIWGAEAGGGAYRQAPSP